MPEVNANLRNRLSDLKELVAICHKQMDELVGIEPGGVVTGDEPGSPLDHVEYLLQEIYESVSFLNSRLNGMANRI